MTRNCVRASSQSTRSMRPCSMISRPPASSYERLIDRASGCRRPEPVAHGAETDLERAGSQRRRAPSCRSLRRTSGSGRASICALSISQISGRPVTPRSSRCASFVARDLEQPLEMTLARHPRSADRRGRWSRRNVSRIAWIMLPRSSASMRSMFSGSSTALDAAARTARSSGTGTWRTSRAGSATPVGRGRTATPPRAPLRLGGHHDAVVRRRRLLPSVRRVRASPARTPATPRPAPPIAARLLAPSMASRIEPAIVLRRRDSVARSHRRPAVPPSMRRTMLRWLRASATVDRAPFNASAIARKKYDGRCVPPPPASARAYDSTSRSRAACTPSQNVSGSSSGDVRSGSGPSPAAFSARALVLEQERVRARRRWPRALGNAEHVHRAKPQVPQRCRIEHCHAAPPERPHRLAEHA